MPPAAFTSSRQSSKPRSCEVESLLSLPVCDAVKPIVRVSCAKAGPAAKTAASASKYRLFFIVHSLVRPTEYFGPNDCSGTEGVSMGRSLRLLRLKRRRNGGYGVVFRARNLILEPSD